jgi:hypothetical protein
MTTASTRFTAPKGNAKRQQHKLPFLRTKVDFHSARYNNLTTNDICRLIPSYIPSHDKVYLKRKRFIEGRFGAHMTHSLLWLFRAVKKIIKGTDACMDSCGWDTEGFFADLAVEQRKTILGAIFDQYPLWLLTQFRKREAASVDFKQLWSSVDSDGSDRVALRGFYRLMFVEMGEATYKMRVVRGMNEKSDEVRRAKAWKEFAGCEAVQALNLGGAESLPIV